MESVVNICIHTRLFAVNIDSVFFYHRLNIKGGQK